MGRFIPTGTMSTSTYRKYNTRKPSNEAVYSFRPGLSRSVSHWDLDTPAGAAVEPNQRFSSSSSSWDLARPNTSSSSGSSTFSSPAPYHDLATGEYRYLHRIQNCLGDGRKRKRSGIWQMELTFLTRHPSCL